MLTTPSAWPLRRQLNRKLFGRVIIASVRLGYCYLTCSFYNQGKKSCLIVTVKKFRLAC